MKLFPKTNGKSRQPCEGVPSEILQIFFFFLKAIYHSEEDFMKNFNQVTAICIYGKNT